MNRDGWTKEPWYAVEYPINWELQDAPDYEGRYLLSSDEEEKLAVSEEKAAANAKRAVACVNALAGIRDPSALVASWRALREAAEAFKDCSIAGGRAFDEEKLYGVLRKTIAALKQAQELDK